MCNCRHVNPIIYGSMILPFILAPCLNASHISQELMVIPWGDSENQLYITEPIFDDTLLPEDSVIIMEADGPTRGFVDRYDNLYFCSAYADYLRAFDRTGRSIMSVYMGDIQSGDTSIYLGMPTNIYVDSACRIFVETYPPLDFIPVLDTTGTLIDQIRSLDMECSALINLKSNSNDILTFYCEDTFAGYLYKDGRIIAGGDNGWLAGDGFYYHLNSNHEQPLEIEFVRIAGPDLAQYPDSIESVTRRIGKEWDSFSFLGVDDNINLYLNVYTIDNDHSRNGIQIYDRNFILVDQFKLPRPPHNKYQLYMPDLFLRRDGSIFQFQCANDGLHVIKWADKTEPN